MIVISGALVLVAAVLLVLGIVSSITLVYAAIGLSIVSAVFLLVGVFQRPAPPAEPREADSDSTKRQAPARQPKSDKLAKEEPKKKEEPDQEVAEEAHEEAADHEPAEEHAPDAADFPLEAANADFEEKAGATGADVLVVSGRPRYHVGGCEDVEGSDDSEPLDIIEARELGFTPCGKCKPNETLARGAASHEDGDQKDKPKSARADHAADHSADHERADHDGAPSEPATAAADRAPEPASVAAAPAVPTTPMPVADAPAPSSNGPGPSHAPAASAAAPPATAAPVSAPVEQTAPQQAPSPPATAAPVSEAAPAPPKEAAQPATAEQSAAGATARRTRRTGRTVCAVAATKEYHTADCDLLEGVDSEEITKIAAIRQGYLACGVCKP